MIGQTLGGRYQIIQPMIQGGMANTFLAIDTQRPGHPKCVVKQLKPCREDHSFLSHARNLFNREAKILTIVGTHNQIPQLLAHFEEKEHFYLVIDFVDGDTLDFEMLPQGLWREEKVVNFLIEILEILEYIHSQNVIHRDIKPTNIIRRHKDSKLVLIDFGAVKEVKAQFITPNSYPANTVVGTFGYMSAEQAKGNPRYNSDLYALGYLAIQALTGVCPTELPLNPDTGQILWQNIVPISHELTNILKMMVHEHFQERFQTATDARFALESLRDIASASTSPTHQQTVSNERMSITHNSQSHKTPTEGKILFNATDTNENIKTQVKRDKKIKSKNLRSQWVSTATISVLAITFVSMAATQALKSNPKPITGSFGGDDVLNVGLLSVPNNPPEAYKSLQKYLLKEISEQFGANIEVKFESVTIKETATATSNAIKKIKNNQWDLAFTTVPRVSAAAVKNDYSFVAKMWPKQKFTSTVMYVREDSPIQSIDDITSQTTLALAGFDNGAFFYMPVYDLYGKTVRVDLNNSLKTILTKVSSGQADVGVGLDFLLKKDPNIRIIAQSRQLPVAGVFVSPKLNKYEKQLVKKKLLNAPEEIQESAKYSAGSQVDYTEFLKIIQRVEEVTGCRDWSKNLVSLYCLNPNSTISKNSQIERVGRTNGMKKVDDNYHYLLKMADSKIYRLVIPYSIFLQDSNLPSPLALGFSRVVLSKDIRIDNMKKVPEINIEKVGQVETTNLHPM